MAKIKIWLILLFAVVVYLIMGTYANFGKLIQSLASFRLEYVGFLILFTTIGYFIRYFKWSLFLRKVGVHLTLREDLFVFFSGLSMIITPGKIGELWKSWLIRDISGDEVSKTIPAVIMDRVTDVVSLIFLSLIGIFSYRQGMYLIGFLVIIIVMFYLAIRSERISGWILSKMEHRMMKYHLDLTVMHDSLKKTMEPRIFLSLTLLNSLAWFCECLGLYFVVLGFGETLSVPASTFIFSFASLAGGVSMIPGGIGLAEVTITGLLQMYGIPATLAIGIALIVRFGSFWYGAVLGTLVYVLFHKRIGRQKNTSYAIIT